MKKTWKRTRPLIDFGTHLGVVLSNRAVVLIDHEDRAIAEGFNWTAAPNKSGDYAVRGCSTRGSIRLHREIAGGFADHINGNTLDCRRINLRKATRAQNCQNRKKSSLNRSGYKGVSYDMDRGTWLAALRTGDRLIKIGYFTDKAEAAWAYDNKAREIFGEFAAFNFPKDGERAA